MRPQKPLTQNLCDRKSQDFLYGKREYKGILWKKKLFETSKKGK